MIIIGTSEYSVYCVSNLLSMVYLIMTSTHSRLNNTIKIVWKSNPEHFTFNSRLFVIPILIGLHQYLGGEINIKPYGYFLLIIYFFQNCSYVAIKIDKSILILNFNKFTRMNISNLFYSTLPIKY